MLCWIPPSVGQLDSNRAATFCIKTCYCLATFTSRYARSAEHIRLMHHHLHELCHSVAPPEVALLYWIGFHEHIGVVVFPIGRGDIDAHASWCRGLQVLKILRRVRSDWRAAEEECHGVTRENMLGNLCLSTLVETSSFRPVSLAHARLLASSRHVLERSWWMRWYLLLVNGRANGLASRDCGVSVAGGFGFFKRFVPVAILLLPSGGGPAPWNWRRYSGWHRSPGTQRR